MTNACTSDQRKRTSPADLSVSVHLATLATEFGGQIIPQYARNANAEFIHHGNIVLTGSHRSNPWIEVYEPYLNFELQQDPHSGAPQFLNRSPQLHEAAVYAIPASLDTPGAEEKELTSYGVLALLKGCGDRGFLVLDEGLNMQGTEAVGDLITEASRNTSLLASAMASMIAYGVCDMVLASRIVGGGRCELVCRFAKNIANRFPNHFSKISLWK